MLAVPVGGQRIVFDEILSKGRIAENEPIYDPDFVAHGLTRDAGRAEDRAASEGWRQAAPDLNMKLLRVAAECDLVAVHWEGTGANTGTGNGLPATGRSIRVWGMTFFRLRDGRIFEEWTEFDQYSMLKQLGLLEKQGGRTTNGYAAITILFCSDWASPRSGPRANMEVNFLRQVGESLIVRRGPPGDSPPMPSGDRR